MEKANLTDYFKFYEIEAQYVLDLNLLKEAYISKSKTFHPDVFREDAQMQHQALLVSSYNNKAYNTLKNDISRAQYLVDLNLHQTKEDSKLVLPNDFLMDMMDLNESIDDLNDSNRDKEQIAQQIANLKSNIKSEINQFAEQSNWQNLQISLMKWKYLLRLEERILYSD